MGKTAKPRRRYRPRQVALDTLGLALHHAAKPAQADRDEVLAVLRRSHKAMREGVATEFDWSVVAGAAGVAQAIERQGIVRGLGEHLARAERALQAVYDRAMATQVWKPTALYHHELEAIQMLVDLHAFQVNQLGRAELLKAIGAAQAEAKASGETVTLLAGRALSRVAETA